MRIGFFPVMAGRDAGGPETYELHVLPAVARADPESEYHLYALSRGAADRFVDLPANVRVQVLRPGLRWLSIPLSLPAALLRDRIELLHVTFTPPPYSPPPYVFTMHDVSMFERPEFYPPAVRLRLNRLIARGLKKATLILCVSEHCKRTVAERFAVAEERLSVAHHGIAARFRVMDRGEAEDHLRRHFTLEPPFLLYLGKYERRKNLPRLLEAYAQFRREAADAPKLVLAGKRDWLAEEISREIASRGLAGSVVELGYLADEHLPYLLNAARMLVLPSLWEGFGLPVVEAMACGAPVVASNVTCLPEIAGGAALLVDPLEPEEIADALLRLDRCESLRSELRSRGLARAAAFTWEKCGRDTAAAYRRAAELRRS